MFGRRGAGVLIAALALTACQDPRPSSSAQASPEASPTPLQTIQAVSDLFAAEVPQADDVARLLGGQRETDPNGKYWAQSGGVVDGMIVLAPAAGRAVATEAQFTIDDGKTFTLGEAAKALGPYQTLKDSGEFGLVVIRRGSSPGVALFLTLRFPSVYDENQVTRVTLRRDE